MARTTVGVFDSGFGGLTVLRALLPLVPGAHYVYLGDTARLPYGAKSQATIARYAVESARFLEAQGAERLVIACNTASALALDDIKASVGVPVTGVIEPGAQAAKVAAAGAEDVLVLATAATVQSGAYRAACAAIGLRAHEKACPLLVPLVEEGWTAHPVTRDVLRIYLREALAEMAAEGRSPAAVLLGCTHYPLIAEEIRAMLRELGSAAVVVDSAQAVAASVVGDGAGFQPFPAGGAEGRGALPLAGMGRAVGALGVASVPGGETSAERDEASGGSREGSVGEQEAAGVPEALSSAGMGRAVGALGVASIPGGETSAERDGASGGSREGSVGEREAAGAPEALSSAGMGRAVGAGAAVEVAGGAAERSVMQTMEAHAHSALPHSWRKERAMNGAPNDVAEAMATFQCFATDSVEKFARLGSLFLQQPITEVELLDLGG